jgi:hypothetical protein
MDGIQDILIGTENAQVLFFDNVGTNADPQLAAPETVRTVEGIPAEPTPPAMGAARCGFGDWNGDGVPDFLIGCGAGTVELFMGVLPAGVAEAGTPARARIRVLPSAGPPPFRITASQTTRLAVIDALGRAVRDLGAVRAGETASWDGLDEAGRTARPGVYFCGDGNRRAERLILIRRAGP